MKYLVMSDLHGNYEALKSIVSSERDIFSYIVLGDYVGYGPEPEKCIKWAIKNNVISIAGNHDLAFLKTIDTDAFSEHTKESFNKISISNKSKKYLSELKTDYVENSISIVHGSPVNSIWDYILSEEDAKKCFLTVKHSLTFFGHTHVPFIYINKGRSVESIKPEIDIEYSLRGEMAMVNPGSVGQPRDHNNKSSYLIFDSNKKSVIFKRKEYNIAKVQRKIIKLGLPVFFADRLLSGE